MHVSDFCIRSRISIRIMSCIFLYRRRVSRRVSHFVSLAYRNYDTVTEYTSVSILYRECIAAYRDEMRIGAFDTPGTRYTRYTKIRARYVMGKTHPDTWGKECCFHVFAA